jgi:putative sigma-54 modulation protein
VQISVVGRHVEVNDELRTFAQEKATKLLKFYDRIQSIEIIIEPESDHISVEMIVEAAGTQPFVAKEVGSGVHACIDLLVDKMERQLTKHKERFRNRKHMGRKPEPFEQS